MATINGTPGNDTLTSTGIGDVLIGGTGNDLYIVNDSADTIVEQGNNGIQGGITLISTDSSGAQGNGDSFNPYFRDDQISGGPYFQFTTPVFSADGTKVIFQSEASNLVLGDTKAAVD